MKHSEFRRWLRSQGVVFEAAKGSHFKITAPNGKTTIFAYHGSKEMKEPTQKPSLNSWDSNTCWIQYPGVSHVQLCITI